MTEAEWLVAKNPGLMLDSFAGRASERKLRLFLVECAKRLLPTSADQEMVLALATAGRFADGKATRADLARCSKALRASHQGRAAKWPVLYSDHIRTVPAWHATRLQIPRAAREGAGCCAWASTRTKWGTMTYPDQEYKAQVALLRCIFGNPFRPVAFTPSWRSETAVALATGIYEQRAFDRLPVLADALEEAGCDHADVLNHLRGPGPHARGCWVVDGVLGKE
jgi:hypothetical protein